MTNKDFYLKCFREVAQLLAPDQLGKYQLEIAVGEYHDCVVLKLYKTAWANPSPDLLTSPSRIFFSVWIDNDHNGKLLYNIHALKLRQLKAYRMESREFADNFRNAFRPFEPQWPNVSTKFGPLTLMQGQLPITLAELQPAALKLCRNFLVIQHLVDETLAVFRR